MKKNNFLVYPAIFNPEDDGFNVTFPNIPEAITCGDGLEDAIRMAQDVLGFCLYDKVDFPCATVQKDIKVDGDDFVVLIALDLAEYRRKFASKTIRKNTSIPEWLNELAEKENINFSQTLTEALKLKLGVK
jgi:Uncharacterized conserved protein